MSTQHADLIALIEPLARMFFGEPNRQLSTKTELRFGTNGSKSIKLETGEWYDHELKEGGGVHALIKREVHEVHVETDAECFAWLESKGLWSNGKDHGASAPKRVVVDQYGYEDASGALIFVVERVEYQNCDGSFVFTNTGKRKKTFLQKRPDPSHEGGWLYNVDGVPAIPYKLPDLMEAVAAEHPVLIVDTRPASAGERCALCGKAGALRIKHGGGVDLWHEGCAKQYFAAMDDPPVKVPDPGPVDEHGAPMDTD